MNAISDIVDGHAKLLKDFLKWGEDACSLLSRYVDEYEKRVMALRGWYDADAVEWHERYYLDIKRFLSDWPEKETK